MISGGPGRFERAAIAAAVVACAPIAAASGEAVVLARDGRAALPIVVAARAIPAERTAAAELADYLRRVTGARFEVRTEREEQAPSVAIHVGPTAALRAAGVDPDRLGPEEWHVATDAAGRLLLGGGRPRGTLYAVYRFLEDEAGVRWWTPFDEHVPQARDLRVGPLERHGAPAFVYRDVYGIPGPREFSARSRLNGHASGLGWAYGGREAYGPPSQVHNFFLYVPPAEWWSTHPEFFSEIGGLRVAEGAQLCLSAPGLRELVAARLHEYVAAGAAAAEARGEPPPRLYDFSQNDQGRPCACPVCTELTAREGTRAAPLIAFLNGLAASIRDEHPELLLDTLAYGWSFEPPRTLRLADAIVLRVSALYQRDFGAALDDPRNAAVRAALEGWRAHTAHLRVWDYAVTFGPAGDLPRPSTLGPDLRRYRELGVEGLFVQHDPEVGPHLQDLTLWILAKLLEDPARDERALVTEFTDGYYGAAGPFVRRYLAALEQAASRRPAAIRFDAPARDYAFLDAEFLAAAHTAFDAGERALGDDRPRRRRLRQARLALDRATLHRWDAEHLGRAVVPRARLGRAEVEERLRAAWYDRARQRLPRSERRDTLRALDEELRRARDRDDD